MNLFDEWEDWMKDRTDRDIEFQVYQDWKKEREYYLNELNLLQKKYNELGKDLMSFGNKYLGI